MDEDGSPFGFIPTDLNLDPEYEANVRWPAEYYMPVGVHNAIVSDFDADGRFAISDRRTGR